MKLLSKSLSLFSLTLFDAACMAALLGLPLGGKRAAGVLVVHVLLAFFTSLALLIDAPPSVRRDRITFVGFAWAIAIFLPVLAPFGLLFSQIFGLAAKVKDTRAPWVTLEIEEELAAEPTKTKRHVSAVKIENLLRNRAPEGAERRFQAILQVKHLPPKAAIAVLKVALKDPSDEVRLFAFARIEKVRDELETKIKRFTAELPRAEEPDLPTLHLRIAESYFEIAYLGLAEGAVLDHALGAAQTHGETATKLRESLAPAHFLMGRILLQRKEYSWGLLSFERAIYAGYPRTKALPYMAECAFRQRRYEQVRSMLKDLEASARLPQRALQPVMDFWR